jgi:hypothetical protein
MVRCADCGFFTVSEAGTGTLIAANAQMRTGSVNFPQEWSESARDFVPLYPVKPICYEQAFPLYDEMREFLQGRNVNIPQEVFEAYGRVATKARPCTEFEKWRQGATPQQHREMRDRERQREYEENLRRETWAREDRRDERAGLDRRVGVIVTGAFGLLGAAVGALIVVLSS